MKRRMLKGYSHPNSPHPSQHLTPDHAAAFDKMSLGGGGGFGGGPPPPPPPGAAPGTYRSAE